MDFENIKVYGNLTNEIYNSSIYCNNQNITTLKGSPLIVKGDFYCSFNKLKNLDFFPKNIENSILLKNNQITSLKGIQKKINGSFDCSNNKIENLIDGPEIINGDFDCSNNKLKDLEHCPKKIKGSLYIKNNLDLKNIKDQIIKYLIIAENYHTDEGDFTFKEIERKIKNHLKKLKIEKQNFINMKNNDFGFVF